MALNSDLEFQHQRAFTRLEFAPRACLLTDTPVNGTAVTPPLMVRNTSLFPATISAASVNNQIGQSRFELLSSTCAIGLVLAPSESCNIRALYRAQSAPTVNRASVNVSFASTTDPQGIQIGAYSNWENALDARELRRALGLKQ